MLEMRIFKQKKSKKIRRNKFHKKIKSKKYLKKSGFFIKWNKLKFWVFDVKRTLWKKEILSSTKDLIFPFLRFWFQLHAQIFQRVSIRGSFLSFGVANTQTGCPHIARLSIISSSISGFLLQAVIAFLIIPAVCSELLQGSTSLLAEDHFPRVHQILQREVGLSWSSPL